MAAQCTRRVDVGATVGTCADRLRERYPEQFPDPDVTAFDDLDGAWRCPRSATHGDRCVLHADDASDAEVTAAIRDALVDGVDPSTLHLDGRSVAPPKAGREFLGVDVGTLDLASVRPAAGNSHPVDLRAADVDDLLLADASLAEPVRVAAATVGRLAADGLDSTAGVGLRHAEVGAIEMTDADVGGRLDCRFARVDGDVALDNAAASGRFDLGFATVGGTLSATKGRCGGRLTLKESSVGSVDAEGITVAGPDPDSDIPGLQFRGLTTEGDVVVADCASDGKFLGYAMTVGGSLDASEGWFAEGVSLAARTGTALAEVAVAGTMDFNDATVEGDFKMAGRAGHDTNPTVGGVLTFAGASVERLDVAPALTHDVLSVVDCRGATIPDGRLGQPTDAAPVQYDLTEATLGDAALEAGDGRVPDRVWFDRTTFDGFVFRGRAREDLVAADWRLFDAVDDLAPAVAYARTFPDAAGYAADVVAILAARPSTRAWLADADPPLSVGALAERAFDGVDAATVDRVATNGPETADQLGAPVFERERYRTGVATFLARELRGSDHPVGPVVETAGDQLVALAAAMADGDDDAVAARRDDLRDAAATALADADAVRPSLTDRELTYIAARKGAESVGDSDTGGRFFVNEKRVRRRLHRARGDWVKAAANGGFDLVAGYGERPGRAFWSAVGTIAAFGGVYRLLWALDPDLAPTAYEGTAGALLLSFSSFTAFVLGGTGVAPLVVRAVADVEAFLGAFFMALFVFTLTRSLHR